MGTGYDVNDDVASERRTEKELADAFTPGLSVRRDDPM